MPSEAQVKNFVFHRKVMFRSRDIQVFVFLANPWFTKSVTFDEYECMRLGAFLNIPFEPQLIKAPNLSIDRYKQDKKFSRMFWAIWTTGAKFQALFNFATCSNYSITNYVKFPVFHFFERVNKGELKMVNINY